MSTHTQNLILKPDNAQRLSNLCGRLNEHIHQIEIFLALKIQQRGNTFHLRGSESAIADGFHVLESLYSVTQTGKLLSPSQVHLALQESQHTSEGILGSEIDSLLIKTPKTSIKPRSNHQRQYVQGINHHDINFGIGPAGTGKTYLAVACAVEALVREQVNRVLLVRPAVEAGEKLGFLPGDLTQKIDPYLRPLYDALYEMLGFEKVEKLIEKNVIEVAPLAYMRGRTLNHSFIILDESQNTTSAQMKMFLTRLGFRSKMVVTGDITQVDLPKYSDSGLIHVQSLLDKVQGIHFVYFSLKDVVRHELVKKIITAYAQTDSNQE